MWCLLEAEDVLLFRDSRPFTAGEDFRAEGIFPPLPPPIVGAIRSALLGPILLKEGLTFHDLTRHERLQSVREALGTPNTLGSLRFLGPMACTYQPGEYTPVPWFAQPADLLGDYVPRLRDDLPVPGIRKLLPGGLGAGYMATLSRQAASTETPADEDECEWLPSEAMSGYLNGSVRVSRRKLTVDGEVRSGIQRTAANTAATGRLYSAQMSRPAWQRDTAVGLLVHVDLSAGYELGPQFMPLGGEGRSVFLRPLNGYKPSLENAAARQAIIDRIVGDGGRFRLFLATAAVFHSGLLPSQFPGTLLGVASGKPIPVGAWDMAANAPRSLRRAVPAGTVYFGRLHANTAEAAEALLTEYHFRTALQEHDELAEAQYRAHMGFGLTLVGAWTKNVDVE